MKHRGKIPFFCADVIKQTQSAALKPTKENLQFKIVSDFFAFEKRIGPNPKEKNAPGIVKTPGANERGCFSR
ncbi:hypothetical protein [uncultured Mailhella sp.]|uniref:hypothetical protein n=1 Tax=uncultured Mailhella sp. TaxID=1981031 RepID=UPI0032088A23